MKGLRTYGAIRRPLKLGLRVRPGQAWVKGSAARRSSRAPTPSGSQVQPVLPLTVKRQWKAGVLRMDHADCRPIDLCVNSDTPS